MRIDLSGASVILGAADVGGASVVFGTADVGGAVVLETSVVGGASVVPTRLPLEVTAFRGRVLVVVESSQESCSVVLAVV